MRRLVLPILLIVGAIVAFRYSDDRGHDRVTTAVATESITSPTTPVLSARRVPELLDRPRADEELASQMADIAAGQPSLSCIMAVDDDGRELFAHNPDVGLVPASVQKLVTATAALEKFGPDARLRTVVAAAAQPAGGVLEGDLFLVGGGDPLLHTADYAAVVGTDIPYTPLADLADAVVALGITQINGAVVANEARYDTVRQPGAWDGEGNLARSGRTGPLSALMANDGFASFPEALGPDVYATPAGDPALQAAALFDDLLEARGVVITASSRNEPELPAAAVELAAIESAPMVEIVASMLTWSDNTTAELLLKELGFVTSGEGSTDAGALAALELVGSLGIDVSTMRVTDGSGLSDRNRLSCRAAIGLLRHAGLDSPLGSGLAVSGTTGTLRDRFDGPTLAGAVHAKTGSLNGVLGLAGFIDTEPGALVSFAHLINAQPEVPEGVGATQGDVLRILVGYPSGPPVQALAPLGTDGTVDDEADATVDDDAETEPDATVDDEADSGG